MTLTISDYESKRWRMFIQKLHGPVLENECVFRQKKDMLIVKLKKSNGDHWSDLKFTKSLVADEKDMKNKDPQQGIMDMMKKMYEEGDDNMKRTITEAWTKAQTEKANGPSK